jgi:hypothetical protein
MLNIRWERWATILGYVHIWYPISYLIQIHSQVHFQNRQKCEAQMLWMQQFTLLYMEILTIIKSYMLQSLNHTSLNHICLPCLWESEQKLQVQAIQTIPQDPTIHPFNNYITNFSLAREPHFHESWANCISSWFMKARLPGQGNTCDIIIEKVHYTCTTSMLYSYIDICNSMILVIEILVSV